MSETKVISTIYLYRTKITEGESFITMFVFCLTIFRIMRYS